MTTSAVVFGSIVSKACTLQRRATTFLTIFSGIPLGCCMLADVKNEVFDYKAPDSKARSE